MIKYFHGFYLQNEQELFCDYYDDSDFTVVGFSYGAIKALNYTLNTNKRVDKLILLSPAFFQDREQKFKTDQLNTFNKHQTVYIKHFLKNTSYPSSMNLEKYKDDSYSYKDLKTLLEFTWKEQDLNKLLSQKVQIEVYLGQEDKIINANEAFNFFKSFTTTYLIKNVGHLL